MQNLKRLLLTQETAVENTENEIKRVQAFIQSHPEESAAAAPALDRLETKLRRQREAIATTRLRIRIGGDDADPQQTSLVSDEKVPPARAGRTKTPNN